MQFRLHSIMSSDFIGVVEIDQQKICMTDSSYNHVPLMMDHLKKYAEAVTCLTASAKETCDWLINTWIARHGCPMTFQSDYGIVFVGEFFNRAHETFSTSSGSFYDKCFPNERLGGKTRSYSCVKFESALFRVYD